MSWSRCPILDTSPHRLRRIKLQSSAHKKKVILKSRGTFFSFGATKCFRSFKCRGTLFSSICLTRDAVFSEVLLPRNTVSGFFFYLVYLFSGSLITREGCFGVIELGLLHVMSN